MAATHHYNHQAQTRVNSGHLGPKNGDYDMFYRASGDRAQRAAYQFGQAVADNPYLEQTSISQPIPVTAPTAAQSLSFAWENRYLLLTEFIEHHMQKADFVSLFLLDGEFTDKARVIIQRIINLPYAALAYTDTMPLPTPMTKSTEEEMTLPEWGAEVDKSRDEHEQSKGERDRFPMRMMNAIMSLYARCEAYNRLVIEANIPQMPLVAVELHQRTNTGMSIEQSNQLLRSVMGSTLLMGNSDTFSVATLVKQATRLMSEFGTPIHDIRVVIPDEALTAIYAYNNTQLAAWTDTVTTEVIAPLQVRPGSRQVASPDGMSIQLNTVVLTGLHATLAPYKLLRIPKDKRTAWENKLNLGGFARCCVDGSKTYTTAGERDVGITDTTVAGRHTRLSFADIVAHCGIWKPANQIDSATLPGGSRGTAIGTRRVPDRFTYSDDSTAWISNQSVRTFGGTTNGTFLPYQRAADRVEDYVKRNLLALLEQMRTVDLTNFTQVLEGLKEILLPATRQSIDANFLGNGYVTFGAAPQQVQVAGLQVVFQTNARKMIYEFWKALPMDMHLVTHQAAHGFFPPLDFYVMRGSLSFVTYPAFVTCGKVGKMWISRPRIDNYDSIKDAIYHGRITVISGGGVIKPDCGLQVPHFYGYIQGGGGSVWMQPNEYMPNMRRNRGDLFSRFVGVCGLHSAVDSNGVAFIGLSGELPESQYEQERWSEDTSELTCRQAQYYWGQLTRPSWEAVLSDADAPRAVDASPACFSPMFHHGYTMHKAEGRVVPTEAVMDAVLHNNGSPLHIDRIMMQNATRV